MHLRKRSLTEHELEVLEKGDVHHGAEDCGDAALVPFLLHPRQVNQGRAGHHSLLKNIIVF